MKRIMKGAVAALMAVSLAACGGSGTGVSGEFTGTAQGMGEVTVTLTLKDSVITDVKASGPDETEGIGSVALEQMPAKMAAGSTINVDSISTATITSEAIKEAAAKALKSAGLNPDDYRKNAAAAEAEDIEKEADVVVIGAGGAGMTAAIAAADAGRKVIILESQSVAGGNSVRSTGGMNAAETEYQNENEFGEAGGVEKTLESAKAYAGSETITQLAETVKEQWEAYQAAPSGYFDSVELMELDTMIGGKGINDPELVKTLAENSADAIDWLGSIGADLTSVGAFGGASVKRIHRPVNEEGQTISVGSYVVPILEKTVKDRGAEIIYEAIATEILMQDGKAAGVAAEGAAGNRITIHADAVIIATGGFGANNEMVKEQNEALDGYVTTNAAGALGQGIAMAAAEGINAATVDMDQIQLHPTVHVDEKGNAALITEGLRGDGAILVNQEGKRFTDEVGTRDAVSTAENAQTGGYAWLIVDQKMADASAVIQGYIDKGYAYTGETYEELAGQIDTDPAVFADTMENWNRAVEAKSDAEFGRTSFAQKLDAAPYYAIMVQPGIHHTMGGLKISTSAEVLNTSDEVIPGLFAAGEVTGGIHGNNRLGGNAVADFIVFGRIAGQSAADYIG